MMNEQTHPLASYPEVERIDYLSIVTSIASADGKVTDDEITKIREFCGAIGIGEIGIGMIIAAVEDPSIVDLQPILTRLSQTDLKFTLLTDMLFMAHADGIVVPGEEEEIRKIASMLNITQEQIEAINKYVEAVISAQHADRSESDWKELGCDIAGILASTGVPLGAVAIAGTVFGNGLVSGLTALGMGMGLATGAGVAVSIGVCSYFGVRWLLKKITGEER
jgi:uncharacterized tellurite resistance protein B-like protein